ncbi:MAG: PIN domain-containing protein [Alphaproteobacteria bacterium]|jgi:predicted nucleic acid-binding protein|nr:PIN domain-containing protein [Alphaproteobacteria bacterium]
MPLVLDGSIAASWCLPDEFSEISDRVLERARIDRCFVPSLFWFEIRNVLVINERRGRISRWQSQDGLHRISRLFLIVDWIPEEQAVLSIARRHRLTVYDAAYLELALRQGALLATLDRRMAAVARTEGVGVFTQA